MNIPTCFQNKIDIDEKVFCSVIYVDDMLDTISWMAVSIVMPIKNPYCMYKWFSQYFM